MYSQECDECSHKWECHGVKLDRPHVTLTMILWALLKMWRYTAFNVLLAINQVGWSIASVGLVNPSL